MPKKIDSSERYWINLRLSGLKDQYINFLKEKGLDNSFDNCNDYLSIRQNLSTNISKTNFGVSTRIALARIISGEEPNETSF